MGLFAWLHIHNPLLGHHSDQQIISWQHCETPLLDIQLFKGLPDF